MDIIEDVCKGTLKYINKRWGFWYYGPGVILIFGAIVGAYYSNGSEEATIVLPLIWLLGGYAIASGKVQRAFMQQFAKANNFEYHADWPLSEMQGELFKRGDGQSISSMIVGTYNKYTMRFFYYQFSEGSGRDRRTYSYTVSEIIFGASLPNIVVKSHSTFDFMNIGGFGRKELPLESTFRDHFKVYVSANFNIEAFEIFTQEIMAELIDIAKGYDFEFVNDRLYIYKNIYVSTREELAKLLHLTEYLISSIGPRLLSIGNDVEAMRSVEHSNS